MVLTAMATLAIFVAEITYVAQVNQKLAYDRLDQIKAHALAKSGLRLALLRIKAYSEIKRTVEALAKSAGAGAAAVSSAVPKAILEKVWSEPITIPFSGDLSVLPAGARDALLKFRKDSGMEGKLYISIQAQSSKFNLNSVLPAFASLAASPTPNARGGGGANASPTPTPQAGAGANASANPSATPATFDPAQARQLLLDQIKDTLTKKFEEDTRFRDRYRTLRAEDLTDEILGWNDLTYQSQAAQRSNDPFKRAPYYDISELRYLPSVDDELFELLESQFSAGVESTINVRTIKEPVLAALVPLMTAEERKKFFEFRDNTGGSSSDTSGASNNNNPSASGNPSDPNVDPIKTPEDFFKFLKERVAAFGGSDARINEFKTALAQRGIQITTDETNFIVRVEATVEQTKRTLEAWVTLMPDTNPSRPNPAGGAAVPSPTPGNPNVGTNPNDPNDPNQTNVQRSNLKITQLRFL